MLKCNIKNIGFLFSFSQNFGTCPNFMKCIFRNIYILIDLHMLKCNINKIWLLFNFSQTFGTLSKFYEMLLTQEKVTLCLVSIDNISCSAFNEFFAKIVGFRVWYFFILFYNLVIIIIIIIFPAYIVDVFGGFSSRKGLK